MAKRKVNSDEEEDQLANDSSENSESVPKHDLKPRSKTRTSKRDSEVLDRVLTISLTNLTHFCIGESSCGGQTLG